MKIKKILSLAALCTPMLALAVPATREVLKMTNPDGSITEIRVMGDEHFHYATDKEGIFILEKNADGYWSNAIRNGAQLMNVEADIMRLRESKTVEDFNLSGADKQRASLDNNLRTTFPSVGENVRSLVILIEFPDYPFTIDDPVAFYTRYLNEENFQYEDLTNSARDYFITCSDGKFKPNFDVKLYKMPLSHENYTDTDEDPGREKAAFEEVLRNLDSEINYSNYDFDNDGEVDTVYFIYSGYGQADTFDESFIWPHQGSLRSKNIELDGKSFANYACSNSLRGGTHFATKDGIIAGMGTFCHEFSHVLGLPDLYDTTNSGTAQVKQNDVTPGDWSIMDNGPYVDEGRTPPLYSAIERYFVNWLDSFEMAEEPGEYTLKPYSEEKTGVRISLLNPTGAGNIKNEFYVIENRDNKGFDTYLPGEGFIIWHLDYNKSVWSDNSVNNDIDRPRLTILRPSESVPTRNSIWPFTNTNKGVIDYIGLGYPTKFESRVNNRFEQELYVIGMKHSADRTGSFQFFKSSPYNAAVSKAYDFKCEDGNDKYGVKWTPVAGADEYIVTLKRIGTSREYFIDKMEAKKVTDTRLTFAASTGMTKQEFILEVRPVKDGIPSTELYSYSFYPEQSPAESVGVDNIGDETQALIYGAEGYVEAPEGARVYNINGVSVRNENLPAGIYIVTYGKRTEKVIVK